MGYAVAAVLNYKALVKYQKKELKILSISIKPAIATAAMTIAAYFSYQWIYEIVKSNKIATLGAILLAVIIYGVVIILIRGVTKEELDSAPGGKRLSKMLKKKGLI